MMYPRANNEPHILMVDPTGSGGICHYIYGLAGAMQKLPVKLDVLATRDYELDFLSPPFALSRDLPNHARAHGSIGKGLAWLRSLAVLAHTCDRVRPDLVHLHTVKLPGIEQMLLRRLHRRGMRIVLTLHDVYPHEHHSPSVALCRYYERLDGIIVHATDNMERFETLCHPPKTLPRVIIPHGDYEFLSRPQSKDSARALVEIPQGKKVLLFFGYIRKYKGLDVLLDAMRIVKSQVPDVLLVIAGKPVEPIQGYLDRIQDAGLTAHVRCMTGYIPLEHVGAYFSAADAVVLPYRKVDQSGVVFMAAGHERPVVVTNVGGLSDLVQDGKTGYIVPPDNPARLADALVRLLQSGNTDAMGLALRQDIRTRFGWDNNAAQHLEFYHTVLS